MKELGDYAPMGRISRHAQKALAQKIEPYEEYNGEWLFNAWNFVHYVFQAEIIMPIFEDLIEERKVKKVRTVKGIYYRAARR